MKIAILSICLFISVPALSQEGDAMSILVKDFRIVPPGNDYSQSPLLPKSGNCYIKGADIRYQDTDSIVFFHIIERGTLAGQEQAINVKGKDIQIDIRTCGKAKGYSHSVKANPDGSKTLNVKCSGNGLSGEGSGQMSLTINRKNVITAYSLKKRAGWWDNFRSIDMNCKF